MNFNDFIDLNTTKNRTKTPDLNEIRKMVSNACYLRLIYVDKHRKKLNKFQSLIILIVSYTSFIKTKSRKLKLHT